MSARAIFRSASGRITVLSFLFTAFSAPSAPSQKRSPSPAETALLEGRIGDAVTLLQVSLARSNSPADHLLLCRAFYAEDLFDMAIGECESASSTPSSATFIWLGRAYGAKAGRANPFSAFVLAKKVDSSFERAVALDPHSITALNDFAEFSVKAPPIVGGDLNRARTLAEQAAPLSSATEHRVLALIARKNKDIATAEREYLAGVATASPSDLANANINLAQFYSHTRQTEKALSAVHAAIAAATTQNNTLVDAASILTHLHREPDLAIRCLGEYIVSPARTDAAPAFKARLQLADLLAAEGDQAGASTQRAAATALAPRYIPARRLSQAATPSPQVR